jgi:glycosyltransferase involved in cell wall biosynthesis
MSILASQSRQITASEDKIVDGPLSLTAIVLTFNEELHIERCIASLRGLAERIVVVDSYSTDRTVEIAQRLGAELLQRPFKNQADQFQWALDNTCLTSGWILRLDADEYLEPPLIGEIRSRLPELPLSVTGVILKRKVIFKGQWIRFGGYYPSYFLRIWRNGAARVEQRWMDEHTVLTCGEAITFKSDFVDQNLQDIAWWTDKHNRFTTRQMVDFINIEYDLFQVDQGIAGSATGQAKWKRFLRNKVFARAPLYVRGLLYFFLRYFVRLGFLDGRQGFVFHFLQGFWNWVLADVKIEEARHFIKQYGKEAFKEHLKTNYRIDVSS